jgi:hypothetical protein
MFFLYAGASLTLDNNITLRGYGGNDAPLAYLDDVSSNLFLNSGAAITGNSGGGVCVKNGTFTMNGGEISGNFLTIDNRSYATNDTADDSAFSHSGGVYIEDGAFIMNGGKIFGNFFSFDKSEELFDYFYFTNGGGVYVGDGTFTMNGGEIFNNEAFVADNPIGNAGAVHVRQGTFTMNGGTIFNNTSGGVLIYAGTFTINGGAISGNDGSGVIVYYGTFRIERGKISGNTICGVVVYAGEFITMNDGVISGNPQGGMYIIESSFTMAGGEISGNSNFRTGGGGVFAGHDSVFTMTGGKIFGNSAGQGGGVFIDRSSFIKTGGIIYGYDPANNVSPLWNKCVNDTGIVQDANGHAVYVGYPDKRRENTAGPKDDLSAIHDSKTKTWIYSGNWDD